MKSYDSDEILKFKKFYLLVICCPKLFNGYETHSKTNYKLFEKQK